MQEAEGIVFARDQSETEQAEAKNAFKSLLMRKMLDGRLQVGTSVAHCSPTHPLSTPGAAR